MTAVRSAVEIMLTTHEPYPARLVNLTEVRTFDVQHHGHVRRPADVTRSELAIELFYPLDEFTAAALRGAAAGLT